MVKRELEGIEVPKVATNEELREFVCSVYGEYSSSYLAAGEALDVSAATVWKLLNDEQIDSPIIREKWHIRKTALRPRVWMPTNNLKRALEVLCKYYPEVLGIDIDIRGTPEDPTC